jgi:quercetin dioxygenase-like cupin family protein
MIARHVRFDEVQWADVGGGVALSPLRAEANGAGVAFLRFVPGAVSPPHRHPGGEDLYVVRGRLRVGETLLGPGDFLHTPPGSVHDAEAQEEALVLISVPQPVEFLR